MKIAIFTETYPPNIDGVAVSVLNFKKELERRGHDVHIFTAGDRKAKKENKDPKVHYYLSLPFTPYPQYKFALLPYRAKKIIEVEGFDIIHSYGMGTMGMAALYSAKRTGKPLIGTLPTNIQEATHYVVPMRKLRGIAKRITWGYLRKYYNRCAVTLVLSNAMKKICEEHGLENLITAPWGIDKKFKPGKRKKKEKEKMKGKIHILSVGRLVKEKNLDVVIKSALLVAERMRYVHYVIVGGGPAEDYYKKLVKKEGVEHLFTFTGSVKPEKTLEYYQSSDIFVFPSTFETQGLVGVEAMACGLPVAGADSMAIPDLVKNGKNGYLFDPHDENDCAKAILKTIKQRKKLKKGAIETSKKYSVEKCTDILVDIYSRHI